MTEKNLLSVENLSAGYSGKEIIHQITTTFDSGKITVIAGKNGCGKSTFLKTLIRLIPKESGNILVDGRKIEEFSSMELARYISYLPQNKTVPDLTVKTMVLHGRFSHLQYPRHYRQKDLEIAENAMKMTELSEFANTNLSELSGGTCQRAFFAMMLAQDAQAFLMDEPTSFLDLSYQLKFKRLCRNLADRGKTVVMVLHDLPASLKFADKLIIMDVGKIVAFGTPDEIYRSGILDRIYGIKIKTAELDGERVYYI